LVATAATFSDFDPDATSSRSTNDKLLRSAACTAVGGGVGWWQLGHPGWETMDQKVANAEKAEAATKKTGSNGDSGLYRWRDADGETQANLDRAAQRLAKAGARIVDFELPKGSEALFDRHYAVMGYEVVRALAYEYTRFPEQISSTLRPRLEKGWKVTREEYDEVRGIARDCRRRLADQLREFDFLLTPSAASAAPASLASTGDPGFCAPFTFAGLPAISLPTGVDQAGLPLAVQLIGPVWGEARLLAASAWCERVIRFDAGPSL